MLDKVAASFFGIGSLGFVRPGFKFLHAIQILAQDGTIREKNANCGNGRA
jgi:hypothetical protein